MKSLAELTARGQARRLRRMALAALERYDLDVRRVRLLNNSFNCIFRVDTNDGQKHVLRINLPNERSRQEILSEMMWLDALRRDTDLHVPQPLTTRDGELLTCVEVEGVPEPRYCVIFSWMPGPNLVQRLTAENMAKLGKLAAQLHDHADSFVPPEGFGLRTYDHVFPFEEAKIFDSAHRRLFPRKRRTVYQQAVDRVQAALDRLNADRSQLRVLHADLHHWNVKVYRGELYALDFDDSMWGYPVQDIAISLYYFQGYPQYPAYREAFQRGYTSQREWPEQVPGEIDTFMAGRGMVLVNYVITSHNPDLREMAPSFVARTEERLRAFLEQYG